MDILDLIKNRATTRQYKDKPIPQKALNAAIEAGIWGPAIHHFQPWRFIIIHNRRLIKKITSLVAEKLTDIKAPAFVARPTIATLQNAPLLICVYNTKNFSGKVRQFNEEIADNFELAEISAIAAAVQNMILVLESRKLGSCWLDMPLFCRKEINCLLHENGDLIAVLTAGYPATKGTRSKRLDRAATVAVIK